MASKVVSFLWPEHREKQVEVKIRVAVVALAEAEWETFQAVIDWLTARRQHILVNLTTTAATGGDWIDLKGALSLLVDQFDYTTSFGETNKYLAEHGFRCVADHDTDPPGDGPA